MKTAGVYLSSYLMVFEQIHVPAFAMDINYSIILWNQAAESLYKLKAEDALGRSVEEVCGEAWLQPGDKQILQFSLSEQGFWQGENIHTTVDGQNFHVLLSISQVRDSAQEPMAMVVIVRDMSEYKQIENHRLNIREAISYVSKVFVSASEPDYNEVLKVLCQAVAANRAYIFEFQNNCTTLTNSYEWCDPLTPPVIHRLQNTATEPMPWFMEQMLQGKILAIGNMDLLPEEARYERDLFKDLGIVSMVNVPIFSADSKLVGFIGFDDTQCCRKWSYDDIQSLKVASEILGAYWDRKKTEEELKDSKRRIADILNFLPDFTLAIDTDGRVITWNKAAEELTGVKAEDILGKGNYEYSIPCYGYRRPVLVDLVLHDSDHWASDYRGIERTGDILIGENLCRSSYLRATAAPLYDTYGNVVGAIECVRDITTREQAKAALQASEEKYRRIVETADEGIWIVDQDNMTLFVNQKMAQTLGYETQDLLGKSCLLFANNEFWNDSNNTVDQRAKGICDRYDMKLLHKDGRSLWFIVSASPIFDADGNYAGSLGMFTDITERKNLEQEMARLDRLNIIGQIAAGIGHEIRNPMTTVRGYLQMLKGQTEYADIEETFDVMIEEIDRANAIITEFLSMAKNKAVELQPTHLNRVIEALYPLMQANAVASDVDIQVELEPVEEIAADEKEIRQLILNLIRNGLEATPPGGIITVKTYMEQKDVMLSIQDQGEGIKPDILDKLGTPFLTTKDHGTGLGLAICYGIAGRHNARIHVNTDSSGTQFIIRFVGEESQ